MASASAGGAASNAASSAVPESPGAAGGRTRRIFHAAGKSRRRRSGATPSSLAGSRPPSTRSPPCSKPWTPMADLLPRPRLQAAAAASHGSPRSDARARAIVYHASFAPTLARIRAEVPLLELFLQVDDGSSTPLLPGARDYETALDRVDISIAGGFGSVRIF